MGCGISPVAVQVLVQSLPYCCVEHPCCGGGEGGSSSAGPQLPSKRHGSAASGGNTCWKADMVLHPAHTRTRTHLRMYESSRCVDRNHDPHKLSHKPRCATSPTAAWLVKLPSTSCVTRLGHMVLAGPMGCGPFCTAVGKAAQLRACKLSSHALSTGDPAGLGRCCLSGVLSLGCGTSCTAAVAAA
jgi:hypothetical protein